MRQAGSDHELLPDRINSVAGLKSHLCDHACHRGKLRVEECRECGACQYGAKLLELTGFPPIDKEPELSIFALARQGQALPTIKMRMKKRKK